MAALEREKKRRHARNQLAHYQPYPKQEVFHAAGAQARERLFMAANQSGKTLSGGYEAAMHMTGRYPDWWTGRRFAQPVTGWAGGPSGLLVRDSMQKILLGPIDDPGTGTIPYDCLDGEPVMSRGQPLAVDTLRVRHVSGGVSRLTFKSYEMGREKWQAATLDFVWFDEEPDEGLYSEGLTRTNATNGIVWMTFTPLMGMSAVVTRFLEESSAHRHVTTMTIDDAHHYTPQQREMIVAGYAPHEREARARGVPSMGRGRIFPIPEEMIACTPLDPLDIPAHWQHIGGMDFGWDHPFAAVHIVIDPDSEICYVTKCHRVREQTPVLHAAAVKPWGKSWMPWAWPHDGYQHDKGSGVALAQQYMDQGLLTLPEHAQFPDGSNGVEAGIALMLDMMQTGRLKVSRHLAEWFQEFRLYHRDEHAKPVKKTDDLLSATRYALMSRHMALAPPRPPKGRYETYGTATRTTTWMGA